jgi:hypothetical protein
MRILFAALIAILDSLPPLLAAKARQVIPLAQESHRQAVKAGVKIAFGTDAAVYPHGLNAREFAVYVGFGMTDRGDPEVDDPCRRPAGRRRRPRRDCAGTAGGSDRGSRGFAEGRAGAGESVVRDEGRGRGQWVAHDQGAAGQRGRAQGAGVTSPDPADADSERQGTGGKRGGVSSSPAHGRECH